MTYSTLSSILFLLLLVFSLHMDEAIGAQTGNRKLNDTEETIMTSRRNLKGTVGEPSKIKASPSESTHGGSKTKQQPTQNNPAKAGTVNNQKSACDHFARCKRAGGN